MNRLGPPRPPWDHTFPKFRFGDDGKQSRFSRECGVILHGGLSKPQMAELLIYDLLSWRRRRIR